MVITAQNPTARLVELRDWYIDRMRPFGDCDQAVAPAYDPATGEAITSVPICGADVVAAAAEAAKHAQGPWARRTPSERGAALVGAAAAFEAAAEELAPLLAFETGKAVATECRGEIGLLVDIFRYFGGVVHEVKGHTTRLGSDVLGFVTRHPHGVVAGIVPWNVPFMLMAYKVAAPLAAGNTVVVKIPEQATYSLIRVLQILDAHLPDGVCTFVTGDGATTGTALVADPNVDKVSFTGSVATGRSVNVEAARLIRPTTLELGGKSPMIVLQDCDLGAAVDGIVQSMRFTRGGQSCTAASRVFVPRPLLPEVRTRLRESLDAMTIGPPLDPETECGPMVSAEQRATVESFLAEAAADDLDVDVYGRVLPTADVERGYYVRPHAVFDPPADHRIATEEIFGPVVCVFAYDRLDDALAAANATDFGLSASVWGRDISDCLRLADRLEAGIVQINQNAIMVPGIAYGGIKNSGFGKEASLEAMLDSYTWSKTNIVNYQQ